MGFTGSIRLAYFEAKVFAGIKMTLYITDELGFLAQSSAAIPFSFSTYQLTPTHNARNRFPFPRPVNPFSCPTAFVSQTQIGL